MQRTYRSIYEFVRLFVLRRFLRGVVANKCTHALFLWALHYDEVFGSQIDLTSSSIKKEDAKRHMEEEAKHARLIYEVICEYGWQDVDRPENINLLAQIMSRLETYKEQRSKIPKELESFLMSQLLERNFESLVLEYRTVLQSYGDQYKKIITVLDELIEDEQDHLLMSAVVIEKYQKDYDIEKISSFYNQIILELRKTWLKESIPSYLACRPGVKLRSILIVMRFYSYLP